MIIQTISHTSKKKWHQLGKPYATLVVSPDEGKTTELVEKDLHFGLYVLGTEKHESRRIDNQLRGRSGRQGDPGASQFYVALDDEIMRKMWGDTIKSIAKRLLPADELSKLELTQSQFTSSITRAQKQMEWYNFSIRKHLFEYDNVVNKQRMKVYQKRDELLWRDEQSVDQVKDDVRSSIIEVIHHIWEQHKLAGWSLEDLQERIDQVFGMPLDSYQSLSHIQEQLLLAWDHKIASLASDLTFVQIIRSLYLEQIDKYWIEHIDAMQHLREKVWLYGYAQQDPLVIYKQESFKLYGALWMDIKTDFVSLFYKVDFSHFKWVSTGIRADQLVTNESAFEDNLIGDMSDVSTWVPPQIIPGRDSGVASSPRSKHDGEDDNLQVIDLSQLKQSSPFWWWSTSWSKKVWPNEPCPCGSGKKYKKCHGG